MIATCPDGGQYNSIEPVVAERRVTLARPFKAGIKRTQIAFVAERRLKSGSFVAHATTIIT